MTDCMFCKIAKGETKADVVLQTPEAIAIRDINPQAPDHVLIIPNRHLESLNDWTDVPLLGALMLLAKEVARKVMIDHGGYRVVLNVGAHGGQTVPHLHLHVLGGRRMKWPPG
ncbi:MAG: histidine triad nucleotide-binding protein [Gemmatimonadales bacterium]|nr:histidine triad nucleotide-binding protein [Gemmatimonadales bacterium]